MKNNPIQHATSKPTSLQLVASWRAIWQAHHAKDKRELLNAINLHVAQFPPVQQPEALARVEHTLARFGEDKALVRATLQRADRAIDRLLCPANGARA